MSFSGVWKSPSQSTNRFKTLKNITKPNSLTVKLFCPPDPRPTLSNLLNQQSNKKRETSEDSYSQLAIHPNANKMRITTSKGKKNKKLVNSVDLGKQKVSLSIQKNIDNKPDITPFHYQGRRLENREKRKLKNKMESADKLSVDCPSGELENQQEKVKVTNKYFTPTKRTYFDDQLEKHQSRILDRINSFKKTQMTLSHKYNLLSENMSLKNLEDSGKEGQMWSILQAKISETAASLLELSRKSEAVEVEEIIDFHDKVLSQASTAVR